MENAGKDAKAKVIESLQNPKFQWRTISGISKDTGLDATTVRQIIADCQDEVVKSEKRTKAGDELFTTRRHFKTNAGVLARLLGAMKNRID